MGKMLSTITTENTLHFPETTKKFLATESCYQVAKSLGDQSIPTVPSYGVHLLFAVVWEDLVSWSEYFPFTCNPV